MTGQKLDGLESGKTLYKPLFLRCIFVSFIADTFSSPAKQSVDYTSMRHPPDGQFSSLSCQFQASQSVSPSARPSASQPASQPANQSVSPCVSRSVSPSVRQSVSPSVRQSVSPSVRQSVSQSVSRSVSQSCISSPIKIISAASRVLVT